MSRATIDHLIEHLEENQEIIFLAGGCFWGVEAYMDKIDGVVSSTVGYANGKGGPTSYEAVCRGDSGYAEAVCLIFDASKVSLKKLLTYFFKIIDPTLLNRQGNDIGHQYRTGIYCVSEDQLDFVKDFVRQQQVHYKEKIVVEQSKIENYYEAETYHQKYLVKNPKGYCHIDLSSFEAID